MELGAPQDDFLSGLCARSQRTLDPDEEAMGHRMCKATGCLCPCHGVTRDWRSDVRAARRAFLVSQGLDPNPKPGPRGDGKCVNDHELTDENVGPRGECRACKREASRRCKARKAAREAASQNGEG